MASRFAKLARDLGGLAVVIGLLASVYLLPPDASLSEVRASGMLRACVPVSYPPLVTGDADRPGIDIEILTEVARRLGVGLGVSPNEAMGRDFNPRDWGVTRGRCQIVAGGVVASDLTRSFLDTGPAYARTGWAVVAPQPLPGLAGRSLGVLTVVSGLDRIGLASHLRGIGAKVTVVPDIDDLVAGIEQGRFEGGVVEALMAARIASDQGWTAGEVSGDLPSYDLVFGMWKGDLTLKRAVRRAFEDLAREGGMAEILARYGVGAQAAGSPAS